MTAPPLHLVQTEPSPQQYRRARARTFAFMYTRKIGDLMGVVPRVDWPVILDASNRPGHMPTTKAVAKLLYRLWRAEVERADALAPGQFHYFDKRAELRNLFTAWCAIYRDQRLAAGTSMKGFYDSVVSRIGEKPETAE